MAPRPTSPSRWSTRVVWALLGAAAVALVMWDWSDPPTEAETVEPEPQMVESSEAGIDEHEAPVRTPPAASSTTSEPNRPSAPQAGSTSDRDASTTGEHEDPSSDATGLVEGEAGPEIPLPRMPGSRFMRRFRRPDEGGDGWRITLTLSIPAPGTQVEGFYRSALREQGMTVLGGGGEAGPMREGYRSTLKGRTPSAGAEVTINQRPNRLTTVVRIYWHQRAGSASAGDP